MGYTHYYRLKYIADNAEKLKAFAKASEDIEQMSHALTKKMGIVIRDGTGENSPLFTKDKIWFNGDAKDDLDCEDFSVQTDSNDRTFTKTNRKPYDILVCCALLSLHAHLGDDFTFSSDGSIESGGEWVDAYQFYTEHSHKHPNHMNLLQYMAKSCHYAQQHIDDDAAWPIDEDSRSELLQCTSFQIACFFAQNTPLGNEGVDSDVVNAELIQHPAKSEQQWLEILTKIWTELDGPPLS